MQIKITMASDGRDHVGNPNEIVNRQPSLFSARFLFVPAPPKASQSFLILGNEDPKGGTGSLYSVPLISVIASFFPCNWKSKVDPARYRAQVVGILRPMERWTPIGETADLLTRRVELLRIIKRVNGGIFVDCLNDVVRFNNSQLMVDLSCKSSANTESSADSLMADKYFVQPLLFMSFFR